MGLETFQDLVQFYFSALLPRGGPMAKSAAPILAEATGVYGKTYDLVPTAFMHKTGSELAAMAVAYVGHMHFGEEKPEWIEFKKR